MDTVATIDWRSRAEALTVPSVWTSNITTGHRMAKAIRAGTVWVNNYDESDITMPFGGYRQSGHGRDKSLHALSKYTQLKSTWIALR